MTNLTCFQMPALSPLLFESLILFARKFCHLQHSFSVEKMAECKHPPVFRCFPFSLPFCSVETRCMYNVDQLRTSEGVTFFLISVHFETADAGLCLSCRRI
jgi:hypothetical protein